MKIRTLAIAAAIATLGLSAQAATFGERFDPSKFAIVEAADGATSATYNGAAVDKFLLLSGASASAKTIGAFVISDNCDASTLSVLWDSATGSNYRAYACDLSATNIINGGAPGSLVVIKRDAGGSLQGVAPIAVPAKITFMNLTSCTATATTTPGLNANNYICTGTGSYYPDAGFSDVEPNIIANTLNGGPGAPLAVTGSMTTTPVFQQVIGVAANLKLYRALQATQGLTQDDQPQNRPSLPSEFVSSAVNGKLAGGTATGSAKRGWGLVVSETVDPSVHRKQINVCRRAAGSGTQAAAFIQFSGAPCTGPAALAQANNTAALAIAGSGTSSNGTAYTSTGAVEGCLSTVDGLTSTDATLINKDGYAIGHIGRDNDPFANGGDKLYRFVKLDGNQPEAHPDPTTGLCNFAGCNDAQQGKYPYVFESTMQYNSGTPGNADKLSALQNIATKGFTAAQLKGNAAAVIAGVMALPSSYSGLWPALALGSDAQVYGSRVSRGGNSCSPITLSK